MTDTLQTIAAMTQCPAEQQVSPRVEKALRAAMQRLLAGRPERSDGRLIKDNLWREAQVSRATMNRATSIMREWDASVTETGARTASEARRDTELAKTRARLKVALDENKPLRARLNAAATVIAALHADNAALRDQLARRGDIASLDERRSLMVNTAGSAGDPR